MTNDEQWRRIEELDGYDVSDQGRVRSWRYHSKNKVLKPIYDDYGVKYQLTRDPHKLAVKYAHALVLRAFVGPRPKGYKVVFVDGNKYNPALSNLRYVPTEQELGRERSLQRKARYVSRAKILQMLSEGKTQTQIARECGVSLSFICHVVAGRRHGVYAKVVG